MFVGHIVLIFREARKILRKDGTLWLNLGDNYANVGKWGGSTGGKHVSGLHGDTGIGRRKRDYGALKNKDLCGIPWRVAFALQADGWYLRSDIIWQKTNPMPESITDRPTKSHEYIFLLTKSSRYYYDFMEIREPQKISSKERSKYGWHGVTDDNSMGSITGASFKKMANSDLTMQTIPEDGLRNKRTVWNVSSASFSEAHFAVFPPKLIEPCILAGCPVGGVVFDPFMGSGTTAMVAAQLQRNYIGFELNPKYITIAERRLSAVQIKMV
jgi:DNA modification methylase